MTSAPLYKTRDRSATSPEACGPDGAWFDATRAAKAVHWVQTHCKHSKGEWAGKPLILDPNHRQLFEDLWGWRDESGFRLYREAFEAVARKNGKSTNASALGLALTIADGEPGAEVYSIAGNEAQASLVFNEAKRMVEQSAALYSAAHVLKKAIYCEGLRSVFRPLPAKSSTQHGLNPHGVIGDEVHEWAGREQYDTMATAQGARRQPLQFLITTAGSDPLTLCGEQWDYAAKVRDGVHVDRRFLPVIFAADKDDDPGDPATWAKANPNLGVSIKLDYLRDRYLKAVRQPSAMNAFKRLHLNIWTEAHDKWMPLAVWNDAANAAPIEEAALIGRKCYAGLDLAWKHDISALVLVFPPCEADPRWVVVCRFFLPERGISERAKKDRVPYDAWAANCWLKLTEGDVTDFAAIEAEVRALFQKFRVQKLGFDRFMAGATINNLTEAGIPCEGVGQGFISMALPMVELDRAVNARQFNHGGNPILAWMASNVVVQTDPAGNMKPDKKRSIQRIDGIPATLTAMALALADRQAANPYEKRGLLILR